jgi:tRNA pseudouridine38-40 synthase
MPRYALGLEYDGTRFSGWQRQDHVESVQAAVEDALSRVADEPVAVTVAGRTDAGVHALGQVAHFESGVNRALRSWWLGANSNLPREVSVTWVREVAGDFHARYTAIARTYDYLVLNRSARPALYRDRAWWIHGELDVGAMQAAAPLLLGEHDFSAFRAAQCQARTPMRSLQRLDVLRSGPFIRVTCRANAFLHHMVRNIVGSLVSIGRGEQQPGWLRDVLDARDRRAAGVTAEPQGLYLAEVHYPEAAAIPRPGRLWPGDL